MKKLLDQLKKTIVFFGREDDNSNIELDPETGSPRFFATGVLINARGVYHLVTAKHVVADGDKVRLFFNSKKGGMGSRSLKQIKELLKGEWVYHQNPNVDLAIIPYGIDKENDDLLTIQQELFYEEDIPELLDIFYLAYQQGIAQNNKIAPIMRGGIVSFISEDGSFYIDGSAFPGNSGSPVFVKPNAFRFDKDGNISIGSDAVGGKFLGIVSGYVPYKDVAISRQTKQPRIVFEENTGLSKIWPVNLINEILDTDKSKSQIERILKGMKGKVGI